MSHISAGICGIQSTHRRTDTVVYKTAGAGRPDQHRILNHERYRLRIYYVSPPSSVPLAVALPGPHRASASLSHGNSLVAPSSLCRSSSLFSSRFLPTRRSPRQISAPRDERDGREARQSGASVRAPRAEPSAHARVDVVGRAGDVDAAVLVRCRLGAGGRGREEHVVLDNAAAVGQVEEARGGRR